MFLSSLKTDCAQIYEQLLQQFIYIIVCQLLSLRRFQCAERWEPERLCRRPAFRNMEH